MFIYKTSLSNTYKKKRKITLNFYISCIVTETTIYILYVFLKIRKKKFTNELKHAMWFFMFKHNFAFLYFFFIFLTLELENKTTSFALQI